MARSFNGTSDKITLASAPVTAFPLTFACWFNPAALAVNFLSVVSDGTSSNIIGLLILSSGSLQVESNGTVVGGTTATCSTSVWSHGAYTAFNPGPTANVFLNGGGKTSVGISTPTGLSQSYLGTWNLGGHSWNGLIAEAAYWNVVLGDQEIASLAAGVQPRYVRPASIVGYWPLSGLSGSTTEPDLSGRANNGTLTGTAAANHAPLTPFTRKARTPPDLSGAPAPFTVWSPRVVCPPPSPALFE